MKNKQKYIAVAIFYKYSKTILIIYIDICTNTQDLIYVLSNPDTQQTNCR